MLAAYQLSAAEAREIVDHQIEVIESEWEAVADAAQLTEAERRAFWGRQFLNPSSTEARYGR